MSSFKVGQKVVCVKRGDWIKNDAEINHTAPRYGEICTVSGVDTEYGETWLYLEGYGMNDVFLSTNFRHVDDLMAQLDAIEEQPQEEPVLI